MKTHLPECRTVRSDILKLAQLSIEAGIEYAKVCLADIADDPEPPSLKTKVWVEHIQHDIARMTTVANSLAGKPITEELERYLQTAVTNHQ